MKYVEKLDLIQTEKAIKIVKDNFEEELGKNLNLLRVSAPLFVFGNSGLNDNLNGVEKPVTFFSNNFKEEIEIVHSLAKWKRMALANYSFKMDTGLYTDMNAIRKDEICDHLHSIYVDQFDFEKIISQEERNLDYLYENVKKIVHSLYVVQEKLLKKYTILDRYVEDDVFFITSTELEKMYPNLNSKQREKEISRKHHVVFISQIGWPLKDGNPHDLRAPDYDDWNLNGDLFIYHPILDEGVEISSMGIRVNKESLIKQLEYKHLTSRLKYSYHQKIVDNKLPLTYGGGIGQSRICLILLNKVHIGEVQSSLWPIKEMEYCEENNIKLL